MRFDRESLGKKILKISGTGVDVEHPVTGLTMEVVVMVLAGNLVAIRSPRKLDGLKPAVVHQMANIPVDRRDPELGHLCLGGFEHFLRAQRAPGFLEDTADGGTLAGRAHDRPSIHPNLKIAISAEEPCF